MNDLAVVDLHTGELVGFDSESPRDVQLFKPQEARARQVAIDAGIAYAAEMRDMAALEIGAEAKVQHAAQCVGWWQVNVTDGQSPGRNGTAQRRAAPHVQDNDAGCSKATGIRHLRRQGYSPRN